MSISNKNYLYIGEEGKFKSQFKIGQNAFYKKIKTRLCVCRACVNYNMSKCGSKILIFLI